MSGCAICHPGEGREAGWRAGGGALAAAGRAAARAGEEARRVREAALTVAAGEVALTVFALGFRPWQK